jgi:hypothetical protein
MYKASKEQAGAFILYEILQKKKIELCGFYTTISIDNFGLNIPSRKHSNVIVTITEPFSRRVIRP